MKTPYASLVLLLGLLFSLPCAAQDRFEIQVYDAQTAGRGDVGLEVHVNYNAVGTASRSPDGELPTDRVFHVTLEPHVGLLRWLELGGYLQTALAPDGRFDWAGVKLRLKARLPFRLGGVVGLALNGELSYVPAAYEANVWGTEVRPVIDVDFWFLYFSVNPIVGIDLLGSLAGKPQFQPAAKLAFKVGGGVALGAEYYAGLGPFSGFLPVAQQTHRIFGALDFSRGRFDLNAAVGYGLGPTERWIIKFIFGVDLGK